MESLIRFLICTLLLFIRGSRSDPAHILPCFQAYPAGAVQPIATIYGTTLYDCLMTCLQWAGNYGDTCASVLWDDYQHSCYLFNQRASQNPGLLLNRYGTTYYEKVGYTCAGAVSPSPVTPSATTCPNKVNTAYFTVAEAELATPSQSGTTTLSEVPAENACISSCTDELGPGGAALPCTGLTALPKANKCVVATTKAQPTGPGILTPNPDAVYFEKFCLPANAPPDCFEQFFFLFPGKTLTGNDIGTTKATGLTDCAGKCIAQSPQCQASVFDSASGDCTLKSASAITNPSAFVNGADTNYYFENGCLIPGNRSSGGAAPAAGGAAVAPAGEAAATPAGGAATPAGGAAATPAGGAAPARSELAFNRLRARLRLLALTSSSGERKTGPLTSTKSKASGEKNAIALPENWGLWSACQFQVGSRRARVRVRNCRSLTKCPDKDIEFDFCST